MLRPSVHRLKVACRKLWLASWPLFFITHKGILETYVKVTCEGGWRQDYVPFLMMYKEVWLVVF